LKKFTAENIDNKKLDGKPVHPLVPVLSQQLYADIITESCFPPAVQPKLKETGSKASIIGKKKLNSKHWSLLYYLIFKTFVIGQFSLCSTQQKHNF